MLSPPVPLCIVKSPPWIIKSLMTRWKEHPLKCRGTPDAVFPDSPVQSCRKFSAVFGTTSAKSCKRTRPRGDPPIDTSKNTRGFDSEVDIVTSRVFLPNVFNLFHRHAFE